MPRSAHKVKSSRITIAVSPQLHAVLVRLTNDGLIGKSVPETTAEMVRRGIDAVSQGDGLVASKLRQAKF